MAVSGPHIIIMAAGKGKRMQSQQPKVLHEVLCRPLIEHVVHMACSIPHQSVSVVVGAQDEGIRHACKAYPEVQFIRQDPPLGTGHAVLCAKDLFKDRSGDVLVLNGDVVGLSRETLEGFIQSHSRGSYSASVLSMKLENPTGYGRILRDGSQKMQGIREEKDASESERKVREVNCGIYLFAKTPLFECLGSVQQKNSQKEYYLTDVLGLLVDKNQKIEAHPISDSREALGINDRKELYEVEKFLQQRVNDALMRKGVTLRHPETIFIDPYAEIATDVEIEGNCVIARSEIGTGTRVESGCRVLGSRIGQNVHLKQGSYLEQSEVGEGSVVGPYAHLRPASKLGKNVKIGNFVEVKKAEMGEGSKASHLSYIGDAIIGKNVNLGCGFITCNYDGKNKHQTTIEDDVFVGSDSQTVAPLRVGKGAYVASGTTLTKDVPPGDLAIARTRQENKKGFAQKLQSKLQSKKGN